MSLDLKDGMNAQGVSGLVGKEEEEKSMSVCMCKLE